MVNKELFGDDESQYRDESAYRKACKYAKDFKDAGVFNSDDEYLDLNIISGSEKTQEMNLLRKRFVKQSLIFHL